MTSIIAVRDFVKVHLGAKHTVRTAMATSRAAAAARLGRGLAARAAAGPARTAVGPSQHLQPWTVAVQSSTAGITTSASPSPAPKRAAACVIGDELLNGKVQDSNTVTLARALFNVRPVHGVGRSVRVHCRKLNRSWNGPFELTRVGRHRAPPCGNGPGRH